MLRYSLPLALSGYDLAADFVEYFSQPDADYYDHIFFLTYALSIMNIKTVVFQIENNCFELYWSTSSSQLKALWPKTFRQIYNGIRLSKEKSALTSRLLYRQKFFVQITNVLSTNYTADNDKYLLIFGYMLQKAPKRVIEIEFGKIIKLVIACLEKCQIEEILCSVLTTLCTMIENKDAVAEEYIGEFVTRFLKLSTFEKSMKVRILALQGVRLYTTYSAYKLLPLKQDVVCALGRCLDDNKRLVRREAVEARSRWFLVDAPI